MEEGAPLIYQGMFEDPALNLAGRPDFLLRTEDGDYRVADAKLASSLDGHPEIAIQLALYRRLTGTEQPPLVYLGSGEIAEVGPEADALADQFLLEFQTALAAPRPPSTHFSESKCGACPYDATCRPTFQRDRELTMVYGVNARAAEALRGVGIRTIEDLAGADPESLPDVPYLTGRDKKRRAVLQASSLLQEEWFVLQQLRLPSGTVVHFDVESNPLSEPKNGEVYLWGLLVAPYRPEDYLAIWSEGGPAEDERAWREFLRRVRTLRDASPDLQIVHYSPFEVTQIRTYARRYGMEDDDCVAWLLGSASPLFDLAETVKQALVLPLTGYGLKAICKHPRLVNFKWELSESGSQWSVVRYIDYLRTADAAQRAAIRREIETYNRDDVLATRALEMWLRGLTPPESPAR
jgi:uncharacterized protein